MLGYRMREKTGEMLSAEERKVCVSCGSNIAPGENFSSFLCPSCGSTVITRCSKCKLTYNSYRCSACGFEGP